MERLGLLPVMTYDNGYPVQALSKAELLALLSMHPDSDCPCLQDERGIEVKPGCPEHDPLPAPAQVEITDEAVEAAAAATYTFVTGIAWSQIDPACQAAEAARKEARAALEAAAPLLGSRPLLDREAVKAVLAKRLHGEQVADLLMELARPMPTREELAVAGHRWSCLKRDEPVHELDAVDYDRADEILEIWALLNGADS